MNATIYIYIYISENIKHTIDRKLDFIVVNIWAYMGGELCCIRYCWSRNNNLPAFSDGCLDSCIPTKPCLLSSFPPSRWLETSAYGWPGKSWRWRWCRVPIGWRGWCRDCGGGVVRDGWAAKEGEERMVHRLRGRCSERWLGSEREWCRDCGDGVIRDGRGARERREWCRYC